jgi:hypothetical protein
MTGTAWATVMENTILALAVRLQEQVTDRGRRIALRTRRQAFVHAYQNSVYCFVE